MIVINDVKWCQRQLYNNKWKPKWERQEERCRMSLRRADVVTSLSLFPLSRISLILANIYIFYVKSCNFRPYKMQAAICWLHRRWHHIEEATGKCSRSRSFSCLPSHLFALTKLNFMLAPPEPNPNLSPTPSLRFIFSACRVKSNIKAQKINLLHFPIVQLNKQTCHIPRMRLN